MHPFWTCSFAVTLEMKENCFSSAPAHVKPTSVPLDTAAHSIPPLAASISISETSGEQGEKWFKKAMEIPFSEKGGKKKRFQKMLSNFCCFFFLMQTTCLQNPNHSNYLVPRHQAHRAERGREVSLISFSCKICTSAFSFSGGNAEKQKQQNL